MFTGPGSTTPGYTPSRVTNLLLVISQIQAYNLNYICSNPVQNISLILNTVKDWQAMAPALALQPKISQNRFQTITEVAE